MFAYCARICQKTVQIHRKFGKIPKKENSDEIRIQHSWRGGVKMKGEWGGGAVA
jgi:hypothetical protein